MSGSSGGGKPRIKSIFDDSDDESDDEKSPAFVITQRTSDKTTSSSSSNIGLTIIVPKTVKTSNPSSAAHVQVKSSPPKTVKTSDTSSAAHVLVTSSPPKTVKTSDTSSAAHILVKSSPPKTVKTSDTSSASHVLVKSSPPKTVKTYDTSSTAHVQVKTSPPKTVKTSDTSSATHVQLMSSPPKVFTTSYPSSAAPVQIKSSPPKIVTTSDPSAEAHFQVKSSPSKTFTSDTSVAVQAQVKSSPPKTVTTSDPLGETSVQVKSSPSKTVATSNPSAAVKSSPPKPVRSNTSTAAPVQVKSSSPKLIITSDPSAAASVKVNSSPPKTVITSDPSAVAHVQGKSSPRKTVASDTSATAHIKIKSSPSKTDTTSELSAEAHVQAKSSSSSSTSRVAASSTAALFARLRKTPPTEIKKSSLENKESCNNQKDESSNESLFKVISTKVQTISENKDTRDTNILNIRKLDERPKGPKKDLLDKFIHMNESKSEKNTLQNITESTFKKEPTEMTVVSISKQNTSVGIEQKPEKDKLLPQAILHRISPVDTKENEKFKGDLLNEQIQTFGKKEEGRKREGSPMVTSRAEKGAKYDKDTAIETKSKISQISMSSVEHLESSKNSNVISKSSADTSILDKGDETSKFTFKASTQKSEVIPKLILKTSISPKLISREKDSPKLILKTSSPGSLEKSIESSKYTKNIESPESTNIHEPIPKVILKSSEFSESFGTIDKSPKFTVKKLSNNEVSGSKEGSPNLSLQSEFTSKISSSTGGSPKLILKSVTNTSKDTSKPTEGIPKFIIKSTQASESSSVNETSHKISFKNYDTVESAATVRSIPKLILKSTSHVEKDEMSPKQEQQRTEKKDKPAIASYSSKTTDEIEKDDKMSEKKMSYVVSPVSSNLSRKSSYAHENIQNISRIKEHFKSDYDEDNDDDNVDDNVDNDNDNDNEDEEEKNYYDYGEAKKIHSKESMETSCIQDYSGSKFNTENEKLQSSEERLSSPGKSSNFDKNLKQNTKFLSSEEAEMSSYELEADAFEKLKMSPKFTCVKKDNSDHISRLEHSRKESLEVERSSMEIVTPSRVGKLCIKLKIPKPKEVASQSNKVADVVKTFKENEKKQIGLDTWKVESHSKTKEYLQSDKVYDDNDKEKDILVTSKEKKIYESDSDDVDDLDESKGRFDETGDDRTSEVNTTLTSNVDDPGSSDEDSSSDDSSDSESDVTANSTLDSIADKDNDLTVKDINKVSHEVTDVINSDRFKEDFINKIKKTSSPVRTNVQDEDKEVEKNIVKGKKDEQNYEAGEEIKNYESCEKDNQNNEKNEEIENDETGEEEAKIDEVNYDYDDLNKDYEEDSDESRMEIVEEEAYEPNEKKIDEKKLEDVKMDKNNEIKGEVTVTKLKDKSRDNTASDIDIETVYRRELDSSSKSGFNNTTSTPKNDKGLKKVRVEDVFTDTEDEEDDDSEIVVIDSQGNSDTESINPIEQNSSSSHISTENKEISEENSAGIKSLKTRPKPRTEVDIDAVMKAFQRGWKREIVYRSQAEEGKRNRLDIYYYSPEGKKLRSRVEIESHLLRTGVTDLTKYNFTWLREPLGIDEKYEIVRYATKVSQSATKRGRTKTDSPTPDPASKKSRMKELRMVDTPVAVSNSTSEARIPSVPSTKTTVHQLPGHKNISFRTVSKATPPKKKTQPPVPTGVNPSMIASMATYSSYTQKNKLKQKQQQQQYQPIETIPTKGNAHPNNRNQVVYTSSICSRQPPTPRIITPLLGRSERCRSFHCTPLCPLGGGNVPSLSCVKCLCLFHPDCCYLPHASLHLIQSGATKFLCPNCFTENKENANSEYEPGLCLGSEPLTYDPTDSEESDEEMPAATDIDTSEYTRVRLIPECPPTPPRSPPPSEEDIQARRAAALNSQWIKSSHAHSDLHSQDPSYGISMNIPMRPNLPGQQGNSQIPSHAALVGNLPGGGQLLQVQQNNATGQRFLLLRASDPQVASQGTRSNMATKIFLPTMFPGSQTMPLVLPQNVSPGQSLSVGLGTTPQKIMPTKWTQTGPLPKPKPPVTPPFMSTMGANYSIMLRIFSYLHIKDLLVASQVSVMWRDLAFSPRLWNHVRLRNICVSNWQLLARFMDRRGTQSVDLRKMRMKIIRPIPIQKLDKESERKDPSVSSTNDQSRELDQVKHNKTEKEKSQNDSKINEEKLEIKDEVMEVEENSPEIKNDNIRDLNINELEGKEKDPERKLSLEEGADGVEEENSADVSKSNIINNEDNKESPENIKDKEIKSDEISSALIIKSNKDVGALDQWLEICRCLGNIERLRALTLPSCQAEMVHQVLQNCHDLTSLTATDIRSNKQNPQLPVFDPSYLMEAPELAELRLASNKGFSFTCNFNFIKLQKLKVLVVRGLTETIWPYLGTNLTSLHIGPLRNFTASNWANIGAMKSLEALWLEDGGNLQDIRVFEALHQLTNLKRLCLFNFVVGPRLYLALKKMTKLQKAFVLPSKEIDALITQNGHMLSVAENTKQVTELVWAIWADEVMDKDGTDSILICPSKIHLKLEGSKRPQEATEIWSFSKLHSVASKNLPRTTFRIMKLEPSTATLMALSTL